MKAQPGQCAHVLANGARCLQRAWKAGENLCISHDIQITLQLGALDKLTQSRHARTCTHWIYSSDRRCSCSRDQARQELEHIRAVIDNAQPMG